MGRKYIKLSEVAVYVDERINIDDVNEYNYISTENMCPNRGGVTTASTIPDAKTLRAYNPDNILLSNIRPYFKKIWYANKIGGCSNDVLVLKSNDCVNSKFLYYVLSDNNFFNYSTVTSKGTKMPRGSKNAIMKYLVPDIDSSKQELISNILSTYDKLIGNYQNQIISLEKIAELIYKEWFVHFRFPGYENISITNSKLGRIPLNFDIISIGDSINYYIGGGWGNDFETSYFNSAAYVIRGTDFTNINKSDTSTSPFRYHNKENCKKRLLKNNDIILEVSGGAQDQPVGRTIMMRNKVLEMFDNNVICASFCKLIRCNENIISPYYFYFWMQYLYDTGIITIYQLQSTGIINFKFEYFLRKGVVLLPPKELMNKFDSILKPIFEQIDNLGVKISLLKQQRDYLLPRLMSGKLEIK